MSTHSGTPEASLEGEKEASVGNSNRTVAATSTVTTEIPDGGLVAWLQVVGAFFLFLNSWYDTRI